MSSCHLSVRVIVLSCIVAITSLSWVCGADSLSPQAAIDKLVTEMPSIFWHAMTAVAREKGRPALLPHHDEFVETYRAEVESTREDDSENPNWVRISVHEKNDDEGKWVFEFRHDGTQWLPDTAGAYRANEKVVDMFARTIFNPSMRPYLEKALAALWAGKDFRRPLSLRPELEAKLDKVAAEENPESARLRLTKEAWIMRKQAMANSPLSRGEVYSVKSPSTLAGAGFVMKWKGKAYAVTAAHSHPDDPIRLIAKANDKQVEIGRKIREADDIRIFEVSETDAATFTPVDPDRRLLLADEELVIITHSGPVEGVLKSFDFNKDKVRLPREPLAQPPTMLVRGKVDFHGNSGAPVLLKDTGEVIGILVNAAVSERQTEVGFELLDLVGLDSQESTAPISLPDKFFGMEVPEEGRGKLTQEVVQRIFHVDLLKYTYGTSPLVLLERPYFSNEWNLGPRGPEVEEYFGRKYLFDRAVYVWNGQILDTIRLESDWFENSRFANDYEQTVDWLLAAFGAPSQIFALGDSAAGASADDKPASTGARVIIGFWNTRTCSLILHLTSTGDKTVFAKLMITAPDTPVSKHFNAEKLVLVDASAENLRKKVRAWTRETAKLPDRANAVP